MVTMKTIFESALISELRLPPVVAVESGTTLRDVNELMCNRRFGAVPIVKKGQLIGIFTERDWLNRVLGSDITLGHTVDSVMTPNPITLKASDRMWQAAVLVGTHRIRHVPIVDASGALKHMLSVRDLLKFLAECFPEVFLAHPPDPHNISLQAEGG